MERRRAGAGPAPCECGGGPRRAAGLRCAGREPPVASPAGRSGTGSGETPDPAALPSLPTFLPHPHVPGPWG